MGKRSIPQLLNPDSDERVAVSHLYSDDYTHLYRRAGQGDHADADRADLYDAGGYEIHPEPATPASTGDD